MEINIELVPHVGTAEDPLLGEVQVEFDQYVVCASSENLTKATGLRLLEIGYIGKSPGSPLNWLPGAGRFHESVRNAIEAKVRSLIASEAAGNQVAPETREAITRSDDGYVGARSDGHVGTRSDDGYIGPQPNAGGQSHSVELTDLVVIGEAVE